MILAIFIGAFALLVIGVLAAIGFSGGPVDRDPNRNSFNNFIDWML